MTANNGARDDFDRLMSQWMEADAHATEPDDLFDGLLEHATVDRQIPRWLLPERWLPMQLTTRFQPAPRLLPVLLLVAVVLALTAAIVIIGSQPKVPPPFGPAANGRIAYLSGGQILTAEPDGSDPRELTHAQFGSATPIWSHDGRRLTYKALTPKEPADDPTLYGDLVVVEADGSNPITIDTGLGGLSPGIWSPDDKFILYSYATRPDFEQIFIAPADGSSPPVRVGDPTVWNWGPTWSPDGSRIAYISDNSVYVMNRDGSDVRKVSTGRYAQQSGASWSPDGTQLLFAAGEPGQHDIWVVALDRRPEHPVASDPASEDGVAYSPDGAWIAFLRDTPRGIGATNVVVARPDGSGMRTLSGTYGWLGLTWSPDGTKLVVADDRSEPTRFYLVDPVGSERPRTLDLAIDGQPPALAALREVPAWQRRAR
jgi:TolB protein